MILRKAKLDDFEIFKRLYEEYQILYISSKDCTAFNDEINVFDDESISQLWRNYTFEQFEQDIKNSFIYMIEESCEIIGYINMFYCGYGKYKIAEWAIFNLDDEDKNVKVLNCIKTLTLPRLKKFSINTNNDKFAHILILNGFISSDAASFYILDIV